MMIVQRNILLLGLLLASLAAAAQNSANPFSHRPYVPKSSTLIYKLGETPIVIKSIQYGEATDIIYINLHSDEMTSIQAAHALLEKEGGLMVKIENYNKRNIRFRLNGRFYTFDPNRIFSREGIRQTLTATGRVNEPAINEVEKFATRLLQFIPSTTSCIIALHNNTDGKFGINSYLPGADRQSDAKLVYADTLQDEDDIFLTTDSLLYHRLAAEKFNSIWQDNMNVRRDGSLSVYCGERNMVYLNCETQHGKNSQHLLMLQAALYHIERPDPSIVRYTYFINTDKPVAIDKNQPVYFGDKTIGFISYATYDSTGITGGRIAIDKTFPLQSNMDFFLLMAESGQSRIEMRIDPTREKSSLLAPSDKIDIIVR
jgi:hypothetical protein